MLPSLSTSSSSVGPRFFSGFTRVCKGLALVLAGGHILLQIIPAAAIYLTLIPARTIPFAWNLITAGYIEQSLPRVAISIVGLLFIGKLLEPIWGPKEFMKFILVVNFLSSICVFVSAIALYYITRKESYLYVRVSGFIGVISGFLVGIKQIMPDQEFGPVSSLKMKAKWLPSLLLLASVASSFLAEESMSYLPTLIFGIYTSWIYLRYLQKKPETDLRGDPSDDFAFTSFFPEFLRPILGPLASIFHWLLCGRNENSNQEKSFREGGGSPLPGSDPIDASRRRERGARALEQRLAAEKPFATDSAGPAADTV